jgi:prepilin-type N-terminal cleavage/methylation domain-containing protein
MGHQRRYAQSHLDDSESGLLNKRGFTLIELMMSVAMFATLVLATTMVYRALLLSWSSQETRSGIDIILDRGIEEIVRDLREAREIQSTSGRDEIRYSSDGTNYYIFYLYHASDSYVPPPAFDQTVYELRKATLTGGLSGTFTYGDGDLILTDVKPPTTSDMSLSGNMLTVDLTMTRNDETIRSRTDIRPRNL